MLPSSRISAEERPGRGRPGSSLHRAIRLAALLAFGVGMAGANANADREWDEIYDPVEVEEEEVFQESEFELPQPPEKVDLATLDPDAIGSGYDYFIDLRSLRRDVDKVVRYTVIIRSSSGAENVFFEGLRCATKEIKTYAYATAGGGFRLFTQARWKNLYTEGPFGYRTVLAEAYICDEHGWVRELDAIRAAFGG